MSPQKLAAFQESDHLPINLWDSESLELWPVN